MEIVYIALGAWFAISLLVGLVAYRKVRPGEVLVISGGGRKGFRIVQRGAAFVWPVIRFAQTLSIQEIAVHPRVSTVPGGQEAPTVLSGEALVRIDDSGLDTLTTAIECYLGRPPADIGKDAVQVIESGLRKAIADQGTDEAIRDPEKLAQRAEESIASELRLRGLRLVRLNLGLDDG